jgi:hypothetical protein
MSRRLTIGGMLPDFSSLQAGGPKTKEEIDKAAAAQAERNQQNLYNAGRNVGNFGNFFMSGQNSERGASQLSGAFSALGSVVGLLPGPLGIAAQGFTKLGSTVFGAMDRVQQWGESLHASNMKFAEFSASMASVGVQQEVRDMYLSKQKGDARADSAQYLAEAKSNFAKTMAPIENFFANLKNNVVGGLLNAISFKKVSSEEADVWAKKFKDVDFMKDIWEDIAKKRKEEEEEEKEWGLGGFDNIGKDLAEKYGRPGRFNR